MSSLFTNVPRSQTLRLALLTSALSGTKRSKERNRRRGPKPTERARSASNTAARILSSYTTGQRAAHLQRVHLHVHGG